ncbi:MAG: insulinase family protein [Microscillaceae bacterium]|jgi:zinc protease|nr:insulinase family protein [Microscillaceae bacterium]
MNFKIKSLIIKSLLLLLVVSYGGAQDTANLPLDPQVKTGKLPNGLTYYIRKNAKPEKRVELRLAVNAGSVLEDDDQQGFAHFVEHMAFNGTKRFPKNELVSYLQSIGVQFGADLNAYTSFDETVYILPVPTDKPELVDKGLQILEDWAHNITFEGAEIDKERGVIKEEWRLGQGAFQRMSDKTLPIGYKGSMYASRLPIGKIDIIEKGKHEALKRFYKDWYRPDLMAVVVVGDIEVAEMETKIKQYFGKIKMPKKPRLRKGFDVPDHADTYVAIASDKEAPFTQVSLMYKKPAETIKTTQDYQKSILYQIFTGMLNQRLNELRLKAEPPFIGASTYYGGTLARSKSGYQAFANVSESGIEKGLKTLLEENKRVKKFGFTEGEFDRFKKQMLASYERRYNERDKTESGSLVDELVAYFLQNEATPGIEFEYEFVKNYLPKITLAEVNALAEKLISKENLVVTINAPEKEGVKIPTEDEIRKILKEVDLNSVKPYEEKILATSFVEASQIKAGTIVKEIKNEKLGTTDLTLSNGLRVILKPTDFKNDEILLSSYSPGGHSLASDADFMSASNASGVVGQSGIKDIAMADMQKMLAGKIVRVNPSIGPLTEGISGSASPKDLETMLQLVHLYFTNPRKDKDAFNSFITKQKQLFQNLSSDPNFFFFKEQNKILTQNHPRSQGIPEAAEMDKIDFEKAFQFYQDRFANAGDFTFLLVGSFEVDKIKPLLETYLASLPNTGRQEMWKDVGIRPPKGMVDKVINKGTDPKSSVNITFTGDAEYNAKDNYLLSSLGNLLDIKLVEVIREEKAGVYGVGAFGGLSKYPYPSYSFSISFPCGPENVESLSKDVFGVVEKIKKEGVKPEDIAKVKEQQKRELEVNMKQNRFWLTNLQKAYWEGSNPEDILSSEKNLDLLTSESLQKIANKYLKNEYIRIVLMPEKK